MVQNNGINTNLMTILCHIVSMTEGSDHSGLCHMCATEKDASLSSFSFIIVVTFKNQQHQKNLIENTNSQSLFLWSAFSSQFFHGVWLRF